MASRGINKVILVGNLGNDPEHRVLPSGGGVTNISLATSESWKDKTSGEQKERTEWHRVVFFNRLSEIAAEYLRKGSKVYVEGTLRTRKWQDQSGKTATPQRLSALRCKCWIVAVRLRMGVVTKVRQPPVHRHRQRPIRSRSISLKTTFRFSQTT